MKQTFIILCLVFIISCKKTDIIDSQNLQGNYKTGHIASVMPPIMYIQNAQITDTGIINTYLRNHNAINNMIYSPTQVISDTLLSINFSGNDSANYKYNTNQEFKAKKIQYSNTEIIIQRFDTLYNSNDPEGFSVEIYHQDPKTQIRFLKFHYLQYN